MLQHVVDTYASETNKVGAVWSELRDDQINFRLHPRSSSVWQILSHQIISEARFFAEFIGLPEPAAEPLLPPGEAPPVQAITTASSLSLGPCLHPWRRPTSGFG
jgi:hypothetical protein